MAFMHVIMITFLQVIWGIDWDSKDMLWVTGMLLILLLSPRVLIKSKVLYLSIMFQHLYSIWVLLKATRQLWIMLQRESLRLLSKLAFLKEREMALTGIMSQLKQTRWSHKKLQVKVSCFCKIKTKLCH